MLLGTQGINEKGHLTIGGCDTVELAETFGTPLYILDEAALRAHCGEYRRVFHLLKPDTHIYYAGKAALNLALCKMIDQEGLGLDVASGGELYTAITAGFPPERITMHGNNKTLGELQMAIQVGVNRIIIDNFQEIEHLQRLLAPGQRQKVLIRVAPAVDPDTHHLIRTGQADTKFGFPLSTGDALNAARLLLQNDCFELQGFHCHIGSQIMETTIFAEAAEIMVEFAAAVQAETGFTAPFLNIGGGLGARYTPEDVVPSIQEYAAAIVDAFRANCHAHSLQEPALVIEPGRSIIAEAGITLYTVGVVKQVPANEPNGMRTYLAIDGGSSDNPRPQMYSARYHAILANKASVPPTQTYRIAGKHCETDPVINRIELPETEPNDLLAVLTTGAYSYSMSSNYNRYPRPAMVLVNEGQASLIVERETYDHLIKMERVPF
jgi:diaminopimelate decarboxylase